MTQMIADTITRTLAIQVLVSKLPCAMPASCQRYGYLILALRICARHRNRVPAACVRH